MNASTFSPYPPLLFLASLRLSVFALLLFLFPLSCVTALRSTNSNTELSAFLSDIEACVSLDLTATCALALRPTITDIEALDGFIRDHAWVDEARFSRGMEIDSGYLSWMWSGEQPPQIEADIPGGLWMQEGYVINVMIQTTVKLGDLWLHFPPPRETMMFGASVMPLRLYYWLDYFDGAIRAEVELSCPLTHAGFWNAEVKFTLGQRSFRDPSVTNLSPMTIQMPEWGQCI